MFHFLNCFFDLSLSPSLYTQITEKNEKLIIIIIIILYRMEVYCSIFALWHFCFTLKHIQHSIYNCLSYTRTRKNNIRNKKQNHNIETNSTTKTANRKNTKYKRTHTLIHKMKYKLKIHA